MISSIILRLHIIDVATALHLQDHIHNSNVGAEFSWPLGSAWTSHQCGPGLIPGWRSDPGKVQSK